MGGVSLKWVWSQKELLVVLGHEIFDMLGAWKGRERERETEKISDIRNTHKLYYSVLLTDSYRSTS